MLREYLERLCQELDQSFPKKDERKFFSLEIGEHKLALKDLEPGISVQAPICLCPDKKKEALFIYLMRANLLGQGTGGTRIGLDQDEKLLTLSLGIPYELNYQSFKETIEDFVNYLIHWRDFVTEFEREEKII